MGRCNSPWPYALPNLRSTLMHLHEEHRQKLSVLFVLLGTGDTDRRVASLLAMTVLNLCHSEEAQRADVGIRPFYDGRGFGPPRSSAPTEGLPKSQQRADVPKAWLPPTKFRAEIWGVSHRHRPLRGLQGVWCKTGRRVNPPLRKTLPGRPELPFCLGAAEYYPVRRR